MKKKHSNHSPAKGSLLFVYGTLKSNFFNPYALLLRQTSTHSFKALAKGELYVFNWYPVAVFKATSTNTIIGECYFIPSQKVPFLLSVLDRYESIGYVFPVDEYKRMEIEVTAVGSNAPFLALAYQHIPVSSRRYFKTKHKKVKVFK